MQSKQTANLKKYKELVETVAKVEYQKLGSSAHLIDYLELVNVGTHALYVLFKDNDSQHFNNSYLSTAIKWAIRNETRRRYKWYVMKSKKKPSESSEEQECLREAVYKTILSIDEMADAEHPSQIKDDNKNPEEFFEFRELKKEILSAIKNLPKRERELIESKFFKNKKLKELAVEFDISPSRVSRIIQSGLNRIKIKLAKQEMLD